MPQTIILNPNDGPQGFLWRPQSENDGKLVILLPQQYSHIAVAVELHTNSVPATTTFIEIGNYTGLANGNRSHWRYSQPGGNYGTDIYVVGWLKNDIILVYPIPNGAQEWN